MDFDTPPPAASDALPPAAPALSVPTGAPLPGSTPSTTWMVGVLVLVWLILSLLRIFAPSNLLDNDQQRPSAYSVDVTQNGDWLVPHDVAGEVTSKPPVYPWLVALCSLPSGQVTLFSLYLPCALAMLGLTLLIFFSGVRFFGPQAALLGALVFLISPTGFKQVALARSDTVFAFTVFLTAMLAWRSLIKGKSWIPFWIAGAVATLTKGPLGVLLATGGALSLFWERGAAGTSGRRPSKGGHLVGVILFLLIAGGWFLAAWHHEGKALIDRLLERELIGKVIRSDNGKHLPFTHFYIPSLYFLSRFIPWSLVTVVGLWRVIRRPAPDEATRRFERFLAAYFLFGLTIFSIAAHQRPDHLFPLLPAAALLAGRELSLLPFFRTGRGSLARLAGGALSLQLAAFVYYHSLWTRDPIVVRSEGMREMAHLIRGKVGSAFPLTHVESQSPYALQFFLGTMRSQTDLELAAQALSGAEAAFVVLRKTEGLEKFLGPNGPRLNIVAQWPAAADKPELIIVSNHPRLEYTPRMACCLGRLLLRMDGLHLTETRGDGLTFWAQQPHARLQLVNHADKPRALRVRIRNIFPEVDQQKTLAPGESWSLEAGRPLAADRPLRVGLISDCRQAYAQLDQLGRNRAFQGFDYVVVNGDFAYEAEWCFDLFLKQARRWGVPIYPTLGNHEMLSHTPYPYEAFLNRFGYLHYNFASGPVRIIFIETAIKKVGEEHLAYLREAAGAAATSSTAAAAPTNLLFMHVPPDSLRPPAEFAKTSKSDKASAAAAKAEENRLVAAASAAGIHQIFCGHRNRYSHHDYPVPQGPVRVTVSGCGGEKSSEKDYDQHWLELAIAPDGSIREIMHDIEGPGTFASIWAHLWYRDLFLVRRFAPGVAVALLIAGALGLMVHWLSREFSPRLG